MEECDRELSRNQRGREMRRSSLSSKHGDVVVAEEMELDPFGRNGPIHER
jgi:hypothetical protein